jgi:hypothetical protein
MHTTKMSHSSTTIEILLIKNNSTKDDAILIKKNLLYNEFDLTYIEHTNGCETVKHSATGLYHDKVMDYIYMVFKNQYLDEEPYSHIQINVPAMPRIMISGDKFNEVYYRVHVRELISTGLDLLETTTVVSVKKKPVRSTFDYTNNIPPSPRSTPNLVRPQHLFWGE